MHVLYLHQHFAGRAGTSGVRSFEFGRILVERGHRVTIITGRYDRSGLPFKRWRLLDRYRIDGVDVIAIGVRYGQNMSRARRLLAFGSFTILSSIVALLQADVDVVLATSTPLTIAIPGAIAAGVRRRPLVFEIRDLWPDIPIALGVLRGPIAIGLARTLERYAYAAATRVIALSPDMREGALREGADPARVSVITNASDSDPSPSTNEERAEFRKKHTFLGDGPLIVYAGAHGVVNGLEYALDVAREAAKLAPDARFVFVGEGSEKSRLEALAEEIGIAGRTTFFLPPVPRAQLWPILSAATILTSFFTPGAQMEGNSANKVFDAFAAGRPLAINYRGWQADLIEKEGAGLVLDQSDSRTAAQDLVAVLRNPEWLQRAGEASRLLGLGRFNRRRLALELEETLALARRERDA